VPTPVPDADLAANTKPVEVVEKPSPPQAIEEELPVKPPEPIVKPYEAAPRFIVQVGAFEQDSKAKEVRAKLEKAGIKTYTHIAQTKEGKRIRVRVGPFATKEEAQKTLNFLTEVHSFPTSIFIDKKGTIRRVYTGYYGPGTHEEYEKHSKEIKSLVAELINE
jgi:cell division septation protein DedD